MRLLRVPPQRVLVAGNTDLGAASFGDETVTRSDSIVRDNGDDLNGYLAGFLAQ